VSSKKSFINKFLFMESPILERNKKILDSKSNGLNPGKSYVFLQKYFYYIIVVQIFVIFLLGYIFLIMPQANKLFSGKQARALAEEQVQNSIMVYDRRIKQLQEIVDAYDNISQTDIDAINAILPDQENIEELFAQINEMVKSNGLLLKSISLNDQVDNAKVQQKSRVEITEKALNIEEQKSLKEVNLTLKISGAGYQSFKNFLASLESNLRIIDVQDVKYNPTGESAEIIIVVYYFAKEQAVN